MLARARLDEEIAGSKRALETRVGARVALLADPHGWHDGPSRAAAVSARYRSGAAAAVKDAISHLEDDPFTIAR